MTIYVKLEENQLDEGQQSKYNVSSSIQQKFLDKSEPKKYSIFLVLILLINTIVVIVIAINNASNKVNNELSIANKSNFDQYELPDLPSKLDIMNDGPLMELDDSITEDDYTYDEQNDYAPLQSADEEAVVFDENNQIENDSY